VTHSLCCSLSTALVRCCWLLVLVLVASWIYYCSLRTFPDLALVFFVISLVNICLQICWTEDASMTRNGFPSKAICDRIRLHHPCCVFMLNHPRNCRLWFHFLQHIKIFQIQSCYITTNNKEKRLSLIVNAVTYNNQPAYPKAIENALAPTKNLHPNQ